MFAKNRAWGKDLYSEGIVPYYNANRKHRDAPITPTGSCSEMWVQSWLNGKQDHYHCKATYLVLSPSLRN